MDLISQIGSKELQITFMYGYRELVDKVCLWDSLKEMRSRSNRTWICIVDFIESLHDSEKRGG